MTDTLLITIYDTEKTIAIKEAITPTINQTLGIIEGKNDLFPDVDYLVVYSDLAETGVTAMIAGASSVFKM